jgi:predicted Zn-dependent protease
MRVTAARQIAALLAAFVIAIGMSTPAYAQSILRDAETEEYLHDIAVPLIRAAKLDPANVRVVLVGDNSINAFVAQGQIVYIHSGLIAAADNTNQVQGVIAHELGHLANGDVIRSEAGIADATKISILSLLLGAAAIATGGGAAGLGILAAGQQAALGKFLAFSRVQEAQADEFGAKLLSTAKLSGRGSVEFFYKLKNQEFRYGYRSDEFLNDHPLTDERIAFLTTTYKADPSWDVPDDPKLDDRFRRIKAKLAGFVENPERTFQLYPATDKSLSAHYARAYAYHKQALLDKAVAETDALVKAEPDNPYFLEVRGQILLESGQPEEAIAPLRLASQRSRSPLIAALLGHALLATEDDKYTAEAKTVLRQAIARDNENPFAWYQLGVVYERAGDEPRAALATAERYNLIGQPQQALASGRAALQGLAAGTPDWLRAQDIVMVSQNELAKTKGKRPRG